MSKNYVHTGRTNQKLETRSAILESAQYFLNNGLEFNLEDIAKRAGLSRATVYRYFSNVDVLAAEAGLDISTKSPEKICETLKGTTIEAQVLEVQEYYNTLALDHELLFRKYISAVLDSNSSMPKRGARRKKTLQLVLQETDFSKKEKEDLANFLTVLMGIEPLIVTKDVCGLNSRESTELLQWGMEMLLRGLRNSKK